MNINANTAERCLCCQFRQLSNLGSNPDDMFIAGQLDVAADVYQTLMVLIAGPISEDDFFEWEALIKGPEETPYEGGIFRAKLSFPRDYPLNPPKVCTKQQARGRPTDGSIIDAV